MIVAQFNAVAQMLPGVNLAILADVTEEVRNQQSKRALAVAKPMWWRVQAERKVAAGHAELATSAERACRQFRQDCEAEVKVQMASIHSKQALRHDEARSFVRSSAG